MSSPSGSKFSDRQKGLVVVGGASRGVGRLTAERLAEEGYRVYAGVMTVTEIGAWTGAAVDEGRLVPVALDITNSADITGLVARLDAEPLPLRALVSVAGISQFDVIEHIDPKMLKKMFDVNVFGALALTQALLPKIKRSKGRLVFVTSMAAKASAPLLGAYSATKAAMESLIDSLRVEVGPWGVTVTMVEPAGIRTGMADEAVVHLGKAIARSRAEGDDSRPYVAAYQSIADNITSTINRYLSPETVAGVLVDLVKADKVPIRKVVGLDAKVIVALRRLLSDRLIDAAMAKQFKLSARLP